VLDVNGVKIGVFALAGPDFDRLVKPALRPAAGATFADWTQSARQIVQAVREQEQVSAVVMIGHTPCTKTTSPWPRRCRALTSSSAPTAMQKG
jgi:2',3'-cyclic-nucleotide 2'-phosphodiesterase (5'-nucleotidase family)